MKKDVIKAVAGQIINMIDNDVLCENGIEPFELWCADGEVFDDGANDDKFIEECMVLVRKVAPIVDNLTYNYINVENQ